MGRLGYPARMPSKKHPIPEAGIRWIVGNFHVSAADDVIAQDIRLRGEKNKWPAEAITRGVKFALKVHHDNQDLYRGVMSGHLSGRKRAKRNPDRMVRPNKKLAERMMQWHSSMSDPIYAVSSNFYAGHPVPVEVVKRAQLAVRKLITKKPVKGFWRGWSAGDIAELKRIDAQLGRLIKAAK